MKYIKLSEYARLKDVTYKTAWNRFIEGKLPNAFKDESGHIYVSLDNNGSYNIMKKAIPNAQYTNGIEGLGVNPLLLNIKR